MTSDLRGVVAAIAIKDEHKAPMRVVDEAEITEREGIVGNVPQAARRRVTFLSEEQWEQVNGELGAELPWHTRRANILVRNLPLGELIGKSLRVGEAGIAINGETEPCGQMDGYHQGLQEALRPECRGGVHGSVTSEGRVRTGDTIEILP